MSITKVGDHIVQITRMGAMNCFLVREEDGSVTVVDTDLPGTHSAILTAAKDIFGGPVRRILLTHAHTDHIGSLAALRRALPKVQIMIGERESKLLRGDRSPEPGEPDAPLRGMFPHRSPVAQFDTFRWNDQIGALRAVASPGHTPGHTSFFDERDGSLLAGDAFQTMGGIAVAGIVRWGFPIPAMATWHLPTAMESAKALRALSPSTLLVGHGPAAPEASAAMDNAIGEAQAQTWDRAQAGEARSRRHASLTG